MDAEIKRKWIAALRSGEFQQAQGTLRTRSDKFCCLGVLCQIVDPELWVREEDSLWRHNEKCSMPSEKILCAAGIDPWTDEHTEILANMNDEHNKSFAEIAGYIEKML